MRRWVPGFCLATRRIEQIALEEWVPTLSPHGESHAGYPHTRSVEREIDKLLDPILRPGGDGKIRAAAKALDESDDDTNALVAGLVERVAIIQSLGALYCEAEKLCQGWPTLEGTGWPGVEKPVQDHIKKTRGQIKKMSRPIKTLMEDLKTALTDEYKAIRSENKNVYGLAILCGLLKELRKKNEKLEALRDFLRPLGLNYQEWLLEFEGVLRDADWKEQYEPGLNRIEIQSVGLAMDVLANRIFGRTEFSYAELAAEARVTSVDVVRRIVRRLALWQGDVRTKKAKRTKNEKCSLILEPNGWLLLKGNPKALVDTLK